MLNNIIAFVAGLIVMDLAWALKLGIPQNLIRRWKARKGNISND